MHVCLNPFERHALAAMTEQTKVCPRPQCGFLMAGALFGSWQVTTLLRQNVTADLYLTSAQGNAVNAQHHLLKVVKNCDPRSLTRLQRHLTFQHPHVHPLQLVGWLDEIQAVSVLSRYEERGSLAQFLKAGKPLAFPMVLHTVSQIALALHALHERYLVHGALKPENCLIVTPETIQVCDWYYPLLGGSKQQLVSSLYLAPEQRQGITLPASDQYALALLTCQLLGESIPLPGAEHSQPAPLQHSSQLIPEPLLTLPEPLRKILRKALAPQPIERFPDVLDFVHALQRVGKLMRAGEESRSFPASSVSVSPSSGQNVPSAPHQARESLSQHSSRKEIDSGGPFGSAALPAGQTGQAEHTEWSTAQAITKALLLYRLPGHTGPVTVVKWAPDNAHLASTGSDQSVRIWYVQQRVGTPLATLTDQGAVFTTLAWSPDGEALAGGAADASLRIWRITSTPHFVAKIVAAWWGHDGPVTAMTWVPAGQILITGGKDRMIRLWDGRDGRNLRSWQVQGRGISALACSADSQILASGGSDGQIMLWEPTSGRLIRRWAAHTDEIRHLSWSPDGRLLVSSGGKKDQRVVLWNPQSSQQVAILRGHRREVVGIIWKRDPPCLLTASADQTLRCWNVGPQAGTPLGQPIPLEASPLSLDGRTDHNLIALGTEHMLVLVLLLSP